MLEAVSCTVTKTVVYFLVVVGLFECQRMRRQIMLFVKKNCDGSKVWWIRLALRTSSYSFIHCSAKWSWDCSSVHRSCFAGNQTCCLTGCSWQLHSDIGPWRIQNFTLGDWLQFAVQDRLQFKLVVTADNTRELIKPDKFIPTFVKKHSNFLSSQNILCLIKIIETTTA